MGRALRVNSCRGDLRLCETVPVSVEDVPAGDTGNLSDLN